MGPEEELDVLKNVEILFDLVDNAKTVPLMNGKVMLDRGEILDLLEEIKNGVPLEIRKARELLVAREDFIEKTKKEADNILRKAEFEANTKVSSSQVMIDAQTRATEILKRTEERSRDMYRTTNEYTENALYRAEEALKASLEEMKKAHESFVIASREQLKKQEERIQEIEHPSRKKEEAKPEESEQ